MKMSLLIVVALSLTESALAQTAFRESATPGLQYSVRAGVELTGRLTVPGKDAKSGQQQVAVVGASTIDYEERLLTPLADPPGPRSIRVYRTAEFRRTVGEQTQQTMLRPSARRMVVLRLGTREVPFSPDGPLTFGEIDLVRTDVYTPALSGLLPAKAVQVGDRWPAASSAVEELTDMEKIEQGGLECRLDSLANEGGRRVAKMTFAGTVRGVNEDGPNQQQLDGAFTFDLENSLVTSLTLTGVHLLQDARGQTTGRIEGKFRLDRRLVPNSTELSDAALRGLTLEPNSSNTLLVYEGSGARARFLYPRRWRVSAEHGRQVTLDGPRGNGLLITIEEPAKVPAATEYLRETQDYVSKQKGRIVRVEPPQKMQAAPREIERFGLDVELGGQPARMEYFIARQAAGGATIAARLVPTEAGSLRAEVEQIVKSLVVGASIPIGVVPLPGPGK